VKILLVVCAVVFCVGEQNNQVDYVNIVTLDDWSVISDPIVLQFNESDPSTSTGSTFSQGDHSHLIGIERDLICSILQGSQLSVFAASVANGGLNIATPSHMQSIVELQYDGLDQSEEFNPIGLEEKDFSFEQAIGLRMLISSDLDTLMEVHVFTDETHVCELSVEITDSDDLIPYIMKFQDFQGNCSWNRVGGVRMLINALDSVDVVVSTLSIVGIAEVNLVKPPKADEYYDFDQNCAVQPDWHSPSPSTPNIQQVFLSLTVRDYFSFSQPELPSQDIIYKVSFDSKSSANHVVPFVTLVFLLLLF